MSDRSSATSPARTGTAERPRRVVITTDGATADTAPSRTGHTTRTEAERHHFGPYAAGS